jgi:hypothetical protein
MTNCVNESAIARAVLIGYYYTVSRIIFGASAAQTNTNHFDFVLYLSFVLYEDSATILAYFAD